MTEEDPQLTLLNFESSAGALDEVEPIHVVSHEKVHLRIQQRRGRKCITIVQGLATDLNLKKILKAWKNTFKCNGSIVEDEEAGKIIQLQGDHRADIHEFLIHEEINHEDDIIIHGV
ncbi:hypothetical protein WA158_006517 [Blastocystis sp. Blastoise]